MRILFENASILLRGDTSYNVLENAFLAVSGEFIEYIGTDRPAGDFDVVRDMKHRLLMPGLVNAHCHSSMVLLRGVGSDKPLHEWLFDSIFPIEAKLRPEDVVAGAALAFAELLASGVTSVSDMYFHPPLICELAEKVGIKLNANDAVTCPSELGEEGEEKIGRAVRLYEDWHDKANGRIRVDAALHSEYLNSESVMKHYLDRCRSHEACFTVHLSETEAEHRECMERHGLTPMAYFESLGYLETFPSYCAHCVYISEDDMRIMKKHGASIIHNPSSNMKLGSGFAPVGEAVSRGINVALGTDGAASNNNLNMFEELHLAALTHKGFSKNPSLLGTSQLIDMATINGARAQGRFDTGVLKVGKKADIIALDLRPPHMFPRLDVPALICYSAQASDVVMTMVDGKILYEDGRYTTLEIEAVMKDAKDSAEYLLK